MAINIFGVALAGSDLINSVGLCLDIVGAILLFRFGLPAKIDRDGHQHLILEEASDDLEERARARLYDRVSHAGLLLLIAGFSLQLASNFV